MKIEDHKLKIEAFFARFLQNPLIRRVVKNSAYLFSATGISYALSMLQGILAARLLGVDNFGILGAITMFTSVINKLISFRMNELVVKYVGQFNERQDARRAAAVFKAASLTETISSVAAYGLLFLLAPLGARLFVKDPAAANFFTVYGLIILGNMMFESATGLLQISNRFRQIAYVQVAQSLVTLTLIAFVYFANGSVMAIVLAYMAGKFISAAGVTGLALREAQRQWGRGWWRAPLSLLRAQRRELAHFAISTNLSASINLINKDSELLWVSALRGPTEAGYYKLALALSNIALMPVTPLPQVTYPELSREVARGNWANVRYVLKQGTRLAATYTAVVALGLALLGRPAIAILYDPAFLPAYPALVIMLFGFLIANAFYWNRTALLALNHPDYPTKVNAVAALFKVALILLLVPRFGYIASAALLAGYYVFSVGLNARKTYRVLRQREA